MNWILPPWASIPLKLLRTIPWEVYVGLALGIGLIWFANWRFDAGYNQANGEWQTKMETHQRAATERARMAEQAHVKEIDKIAQNLIEERNRGYQERDKVIADLRAGSVRLRDRFKCSTRPAVSSSGPASAGSDGGTQGGLSDNDAEFFVREASRADEVVRQLTACQAVIRSDRK